MSQEIGGLIESVTKEVVKDGNAAVGTIGKDLYDADKTANDAAAAESVQESEYNGHAATPIGQIFTTIGGVDITVDAASILAAKADWDTSITNTKNAKEALDAVYVRDDYDAGVTNLTISDAKTSMKAVDALEK
ncbi:hypothetical protein, partial [Yersinia rohdei]|uniref:hypothetical protein n=1 Tax=Yersinia rohdei TaxID=29485 RepID=UPI0011A80256